MMKELKLKTIAKELKLHPVTCKDNLDKNVTTAYISDLLSDVMGNAASESVWLTIQTHINIVAVAALKDLSAIIITSDAEPEQFTIEKAEKEGVVILKSDETTFFTAGKLFNLLKN